jgi:hypothetical protein
MVTFFQVIFDIDEKHRFRDFRPATFRTLRMLAGITEEWYLRQFSDQVKEQLSEGRSDAFLFYAGSLIVKTITQTEAKVLLNILDDYREHIKENPHSLLVRFFGLHSLTFYRKEFMFVVMKNIFPKNLIINERYDIKGQWVDNAYDTVLMLVILSLFSLRTMECTAVVAAIIIITIIVIIFCVLERFLDWSKC